MLLRDQHDESADTAVLAPASHAPSFTAAAETASPSGPLDTFEMEAIAFNLQAAVRVHTDCQFFSWTQGALQSLLAHELLICITANGEHGFNRIASFSTATHDPSLFDRLCRQEMGLMQKLVQEWRSNHFEPIIHHVEREEMFDSSALARELKRIDAPTLLVHGTCAADGSVAGICIFAGREMELGPRQAYLAELLMPFLHAAWIRTRITPTHETRSGTSHERDLLTAREQEVLKWIYLGKSNIEIGLILGISQLTVKNHVQEILRRLNVLNRAQAVGKALSLHLIST